MRLTKFSLAALLAACALAAATPGSKHEDTSSSSDSDSDSKSDSCTSSSSSSSDDCSHGKGHHHPKDHMTYPKHMAPWQHHGDNYWQGPYDYHHFEQWKRQKKGHFFNGVYVWIDGEFKKVSALITFILRTGLPEVKFFHKGCTAVDHKVNLVTVAALNSIGKVKTTFYSSLHDCEHGKDPIKKIGTAAFADLDGKHIGAVKVSVPESHKKSGKHKEHRKHRGHGKDKHDD